MSKRRKIVPSKSGMVQSPPAHHLLLSVADQEVFARALINPSKANAALKCAFARAKGNEIVLRPKDK